jgi:hypothetical protein
MAVKTHVTKIEAAQEGGALVSVVIESDLGPIELEVHADLKTDAQTTDPIVGAIDEVRSKLREFGRDFGSRSIFDFFDTIGQKPAC